MRATCFRILCYQYSTTTFSTNSSHCLTTTLDVDSELLSTQAASISDAAQVRLLTDTDVTVDGQARQSIRRGGKPISGLSRTLLGKHITWYWYHSYKCEQEGDKKKMEEVLVLRYLSSTLYGRNYSLWKQNTKSRPQQKENLRLVRSLRLERGKWKGGRVAARKKFKVWGGGQPRDK